MPPRRQHIKVAEVDGLGEGATANFGPGHDDIARGDHTHAEGNRYRQYLYIIDELGEAHLVVAGSEVAYILSELE